MTPTQFEILARTLWPRLHSEALRITGSSDEAADVAQDTMLKLWSMASRLGELKSVEAFAVTVARNMAVNSLRRGGRERFVPLSDDLNRSEPSPEDTLIEQQRNSCADAVMASLPDAQQTLLRMRHIEGYDNATIAALLGSTEGAVRTALSRARRNVARIFEVQSNL